MQQIKMPKIRINGIANIIRDQFENSSLTTVTRYNKLIHI